MTDPVAEMLRRSPITDRQRADLWDAYEDSADEDALATAMTSLKIPNVVKARLWDLKASKATATPDPFDPDKDTLDEEMRTPAIGTDPRLEPESMMNEAQQRKLRNDTVAGLATYGSMVASGPVGRVLANPMTSGVIAGGKTLLDTGDPVKAGEAGIAAYTVHKGVGAVMGLAGKAISKALSARLQHQISRAAIAEAPAVAKAAEEAAPAVVKAAEPTVKATEQEIEALLIRATDATAPPKVRFAARAALQRAGWTPEAGMVARPIVEEAAPAAAEAAPVVTGTAAPVARKLAPIPAKGNVKPATVYTPTPVQGPKPLTEAQAAIRAKQLQAAKDAGVDLGEAFGGALRPSTEQAAESALETRLRASVMMKNDKAGLANEIAEKVIQLRAQGGKAASSAKIAKVIERQYGLPPTNVSQMVQMILREHAK